MKKYGIVKECTLPGNTLGYDTSNCDTSISSFKHQVVQLVALLDTPPMSYYQLMFYVNHLKENSNSVVVIVTVIFQQTLKSLS